MAKVAKKEKVRSAKVRAKEVEKDLKLVSKEVKKASMPEWFSKLTDIFESNISRVFILHGDINGLFINPDIFVLDELKESKYISLKYFLEKVFDQRDLSIFYSISSGMRFLPKSGENKFKKIVGLTSDDNDSKDPVAEAKNALAKKKDLPKEPEVCLPMIEKVLRKNLDSAVVIFSAHFIAPASGGGIMPATNDRVNIETLKTWAQSEQIRYGNNIVFLVTDQLSSISSELRQGAAYPILIPKPLKNERSDFISSLIDDKNIDFDFSIDEFVIATQGMNLRQINEIYLYAKEKGTKLSLQDVKNKKGEILNNEYGDILEIVEPKLTLDDIGGLEDIKDDFQFILKAIREGEVRLIPMGITLMGPPGTGKTAIVQALAKEAGFNFVKMKNLRSMWVGESEARAEKLILALRNLAPVVVMNDEADLAEAGRDSYKGDSGVSERLMKVWMEFLSDSEIRGQVIVINCTNRPDRIDAALKRSGRSDKRIPLLMPSAEERMAIFKVMFRRHKISTTIDDFSIFAQLSDGLSGADIEKIVLSSYEFAFVAGKKEVDAEALKNSLADFIPSANQKEIDFMTLMAILESSSRKLLPKNIRQIIGEIEERNLVDNLPEIMERIKGQVLGDKY